MFSIFINDLVDAVSFALMLLFADDVKIFKEIVDTSASRMLQEYINKSTTSTFEQSEVCDIRGEQIDIVHRYELGYW